MHTKRISYVNDFIYSVPLPRIVATNLAFHGDCVAADPKWCNRNVFINVERYVGKYESTFAASAWTSQQITRMRGNTYERYLDELSKCVLQKLIEN